MKEYKVSVSDEKVEFFKQLLDNLNINYSSDAISKESSLGFQKKDTEPKVQVKPSNADLLNQHKGITKEQRSIQEVLNKLDQMRK